MMNKRVWVVVLLLIAGAAYALQKAGKDFDLMIYPKARHGVTDNDQRLHMRQLVWKKVQEHLKPGA